ncbi:SDR family NAD(P)-dependent oxidoreductase [Streptomyces sp. NPDC127110]|uniref:SDR family NAD(P)-dependent oxidoreductase n=1 Tax=Streptomyces sp. NPDC127110 TaxID=3345362 RepID=UPI0036393999
MRADAAAPAGGDRREEAVLEYLRGTRELVEAQRAVLLGYLGAAAPAPPGAQAPGPVEARPHGLLTDGGAAPVAVPVPAAAEPVPVPAATEAAAPRTAGEVMDAVLEVVHTRTGYPRDMLDPELDLEADLSIDSIKRVEIIGALADRIGLPREPGGSTGSAVEELSRIKTLRGIVDWIVARAVPGSPTAAATVGPEPEPGPEPPAVPAPAPLARLRVEAVPLAAAAGDPEELRGLRIGIVEDGQGLASALGGALRERGAGVRLLAGAEAGLDGIVDLSALRAGAEPVLPGAFEGLRQALAGGTGRLLLVTAPGTAGAGLHGFARSAALEFPGTLVRAVEVHPKEDPEQTARLLLAELACGAGALDWDGASVGYAADGTRFARRAVPAAQAASGRALPLGPDSVVLLTGGARGITARTALALARATGCHVELVGRTPEPPPGEDPFGQARDRVALRAALIASGLRTPAEIEAAASRILAAREVRAALDGLAGAAASVRYHRADVTDGAAVRAVVADVRARHGRLDGIVHGAGVLRDGLLREKRAADFAEVFAVKAGGARHLAAAAAEHGTGPAPRFLALFGSVAGVYGNRGQCDYAAANDALDTLAHAWAESFPGRVLSVDWGPWAAEAGGMVTPELEREYARRGIPLIAPEAGAAAFLAELADGDGVQVVLAAAGAEGRGDE